MEYNFHSQCRQGNSKQRNGKKKKKIFEFKWVEFEAHISYASTVDECCGFDKPNRSNALNRFLLWLRTWAWGSIGHCVYLGWIFFPWAFSRKRVLLTPRVLTVQHHVRASWGNFNGKNQSNCQCNILNSVFFFPCCISMKNGILTCHFLFYME